MPLNWIDVTGIPFDALLLLERAQIGWFRGWRFPEPDLCQALAAHPHVAWFLRHKCPEIGGWLDAELAHAAELEPLTPEALRRAEINVLDHMQDLLVYALNPAEYDAQPFLQWDSCELTDLVDFRGQTVIDVGAGTGRLTFAAAPLARVVYAVDPVANLRDYLRRQARLRGLTNVYAVDGLITQIPFEDAFAGIVMAGHTYGDEPEAEINELFRVARSGGLIILCPGNNDIDDAAHQALIERGFQWSRFQEPGSAGMVRKYWARKGGE